MLNPNRYFDPDPATRRVARALYERAASLPLVCPHGHVDPTLLAEDAPFPDPAALLVVPDHYVTRMLYSQGVPLERLGIQALDGAAVESDPRKVWQLFADHFHLFRATPTGCWLTDELEGVFGISQRLESATAMAIYDELQEKLARPEFRPRALFDRFNIEVLCTTDAASDTLEAHQRIRSSGWKGNIRPTFRPDLAVDIRHPRWRAEITRLGEQAGQEITQFRTFVAALEERRNFFKAQGASATDHAVITPYTHELPDAEAEVIFTRALKGQASADDAQAFTAHMLMEFARMSVEDGLVMQIHPGSLRNHNQRVHQRFGSDRGCDIPVATEYTRNLHALLNKYGNEPTFTLVLFTLDESTYTRELAPIAGHYPAVRLGPPWWFYDSIEGMLRFRHAVTETTGFYNTAGFNDDTRAFPSIPARHDLCRRVDATFLARLVTRHILEEEEAHELIVDLSYTLAKRTYRLD
ncbi:MAG: glucuronate isomerase [Luteitalea sp.]|nr:glucuronate isomerase [Luteitalea sp.]